MECKFYEVMQMNYETPKLRLDHLYQLAAYLGNRSTLSSALKSEGILIYAQTGETIDFHYTIMGFSVRVVTLDLNQHWAEIEKKLLCLLTAGA